VYSGLGDGANRVRNAMAEKTRQDAVGSTVSPREKLFVSDGRRVVLAPEDPPARKTAAKKLEECALRWAFCRYKPNWRKSYKDYL